MANLAEEAATKSEKKLKQKRKRKSQKSGIYVWNLFR